MSRRRRLACALIVLVRPPVQAPCCEIADNFRLLDRDRDGRLTPQEVGTLFRAFGQNPTDEELRELLKTALSLALAAWRTLQSNGTAVVASAQVPAGGLDRPGFEAFFSGNYRTECR
eukprot:455574-Amphidinium_carterae.1